MNTLGTLLSSRRRQAGLTQQDVAEMCGVTRSALNAIEQGTTKTIAPDLANKLHDCISVTVADICRAMGYEIPVRPSPLPGELEEYRHILESAEGLELDGLLLILRGIQTHRQEKARRAQA